MVMVFEHGIIPGWGATNGGRIPPFLTNKGMRGSNQKTSSGLSATLNVNKNNYQGSVRRGVSRLPILESKRMVGCIAEMGEC